MQHVSLKCNILSENHQFWAFFDNYSGS